MTWGLLDILIHLKRVMICIDVTPSAYNLIYYYGVTILFTKACFLEVAILYQAKNILPTATDDDLSFSLPFTFLMIVHPLMSLYVANAAAIMNEKPPQQLMLKTNDHDDKKGKKVDNNKKKKRK